MIEIRVVVAISVLALISSQIYLPAGHLKLTINFSTLRMALLGQSAAACVQCTLLGIPLDQFGSTFVHCTKVHPHWSNVVVRSVGSSRTSRSNDDIASFAFCDEHILFHNFWQFLIMQYHGTLYTAYRSPQNMNKTVKNIYVISCTVWLTCYASRKSMSAIITVIVVDGLTWSINHQHGDCDSNPSSMGWAPWWWLPITDW